MIRAGLHCQRQLNRIVAPVSPPSPESTTRADIGSAVLRFTSRPSVGFNAQNKVKRSRYGCLYRKFVGTGFGRFGTYQVRLSGWASVLKTILSKSNVAGGAKSK